MMNKLINNHDEKESCLYLLYFLRYRLFRLFNTFFFRTKKVKKFSTFLGASKKSYMVTAEDFFFLRTFSPVALRPYL